MLGEEGRESKGEDCGLCDGSPVSHLHLSGFIGEIGMAEVKGEGMQRET